MSGQGPRSDRAGLSGGRSQPDGAEPAVVAARASGLVQVGQPLLVLLSGGGDSVCLLDVAVRLGARVSALHVNYGRREGADADTDLCQALCERLDVPLAVERVELPAEGNLQDRARDARYELAEQLAETDYATAHTLSDQAETVLYRLVVSPGSRALHGMAARRGRLVRPLLALTRSEVRDYLHDRGLEWREDPSNADRRFARARIRHDVLDALRDLSPAAERTIAETARQLREEGALLEEEAIAAIARLEAEGGSRGDRAGAMSGVAAAAGGRDAPTVSLAALGAEPPALQRLVLRQLAERAAGGPRALSRREAEEIVALGDAGSRSLDLGGGLRAFVVYGELRFELAEAERSGVGADSSPDPVALPIPGRVRFGAWEVEATLGTPDETETTSGALAHVAVVPLGPSATVRGWREGDRMRPLGLGGSKTLQDLFTDRKVPRAARQRVPVVEAGGEIVWVPGVALDERFAVAPGAQGAVGLAVRSLG
jgi:tRNA(Ile)-lysidine synthase